MNSEIKREEEVFLEFLVSGEKMLRVPKKDWEEKWKEKVENAEQYQLNRLVYEMGHKCLNSEDYLEFKLQEVWHEVRSA